jgi:hypothetical protein
MKLISKLNKLLPLCPAPFRYPFRAACERTRTGSTPGYLRAKVSSGSCEVRSRTSSSGSSEIGTKPLTSLNFQYLTQSLKYPPPLSSPPAGPAPTYLPQNNSAPKAPNGPPTNNPAPKAPATNSPAPNEPPKGVPTQGYPIAPVAPSSLPVGSPPAKDVPQDDRAPKHSGGSSPPMDGPVTNKSPQDAPPSKYVVGPGDHQAVRNLIL